MPHNKLKTGKLHTFVNITKEEEFKKLNSFKNISAVFYKIIKYNLSKVCKRLQYKPSWFI